MRFYVQDTRSYVGNSMLWWRKGDAGYTCELGEAKVWSQEELDAACLPDHFVAWPQPYINARVSRHVDMQHVDREQAEVYLGDIEEAREAARQGGKA